MNKFNLLIAGTLMFTFAELPLGVSGAMAHSKKCSCTTPHMGDDGNDRVGFISSTVGEVLVSASIGFGNAQSGQSLFMGSQVITGSDGKSSLVVGRCKTTVPKNSTLIISKLDKNICLGIKHTNVDGAFFNTGNAAIGGIVLTGGGLGLIVAIGNNGVSK